MFADNYIKSIGTATAREAQAALGLRLFKKYSAEMAGLEPGVVGDKAAAIAAAVTNRIFGVPPANDYQRDNPAHIEGEARRIAEDHRLCLVLSGAAYCASYARYVTHGGSRGMFSNRFLAYVRAVSKGSSYLDVQLKSEREIDALDAQILSPIRSMIELGIFRPLPYNPDERQFYRDAHEFAVENGVPFK